MSLQETVIISYPGFLFQLLLEKAISLPLIRFKKGGFEAQKEPITRAAFPSGYLSRFSN
jgi:hypothetical protein